MAHSTTPVFILQIQPDEENYTLNVVDGEFSEAVEIGEVATVTHGGETYVACAYDGENDEIFASSVVRASDHVTFEAEIEMLGGEGDDEGDGEGEESEDAEGDDAESDDV